MENILDNEKIRFAFSKVKEDMSFLGNEIHNLKNEIIEIKDLLKAVHKELNYQKLQEINQNHQVKPSTDRQTDTSTLRHEDSTDPTTSTHTSTVRQEIEGLKSPNLSVSIGNEGVSTDRQTDTSTDISTHKFSKIEEPNLESNIQKASEILDSLDGLKKEIRLKFKRVTEQEMAVFSTIYQLEEQDPKNTTYKQLALRLNLSESSIRDYVQRMISKGIPVKKQKINNKKITLSISPELKKIATLSTIIQLRGL